MEWQQRMDAWRPLPLLTRSMCADLPREISPEGLAKKLPEPHDEDV